MGIPGIRTIKLRTEPRIRAGVSVRIGLLDKDMQQGIVYSF